MELIATPRHVVKANPKATAPWDKKDSNFGGAGAMDPRSVQLFIGLNAMAHKESKGNFDAVKAILSCLYEGSILPTGHGASRGIEIFHQASFG